MIDYLALALCHALILIALLRINLRSDLDHETLSDGGAVGENPTGRKRSGSRRHARGGKRDA